MIANANKSLKITMTAFAKQKFYNKVCKESVFYFGARL
jgi:hypothetical protein